MPVDGRLLVGGFQRKNDFRLSVNWFRASSFRPRIDDRGCVISVTQIFRISSKINCLNVVVRCRVLGPWNRNATPGWEALTAAVRVVSRLHENDVCGFRFGCHFSTATSVLTCLRFPRAPLAIVHWAATLPLICRRRLFYFYLHRLIWGLLQVLVFLMPHCLYRLRAFVSEWLLVHVRLLRNKAVFFFLIFVSSSFPVP